MPLMTLWISKNIFKFKMIYWAIKNGFQRVNKKGEAKFAF